jgi:WhiB family redox-sensing transcriptional regulator
MSDDIDMSWAAKGACRNMNVETFYPENGAQYSRRHINDAKMVCESCEVRIPCLEYSLKYETLGIWGGMTESERRRFRLKNNIALNRNRFALANFIPISSRPNKYKEASNE